MLMTARLDAVNHWWVASLVNYNFKLYYRARKTNIDVSTLSWMSWPSCMRQTSGIHHQVTAAEYKPYKRPPSKVPLALLRCVAVMVGDGPQVTCMNADNWCQAQKANPVLSLMISRMQDGTLGQSLCKPTDLPELFQFLWECNHLRLRWGILYRKLLPNDSQEAQFQLVLLATHWETMLRGCHDEVSHLGLKCMLHLICDCFFWPWMATQARNMLRSVASVLPSRQSNSRLPWKISWPPIPWS